MDGWIDEWIDAWRTWTGLALRPPVSRAGLSLFQVVVGFTGSGAGLGEGPEDPMGTCLLGNHLGSGVPGTGFPMCHCASPRGLPGLAMADLATGTSQAAHLGFQPAVGRLERELPGGFPPEARPQAHTKVSAGSWGSQGLSRGDASLLEETVLPLESCSLLGWGRLLVLTGVASPLGGTRNS